MKAKIIKTRCRYCKHYKMLWGEKCCTIGLQIYGKGKDKGCLCNSKELIEAEKSHNLLKEHISRQL